MSSDTLIGGEKWRAVMNNFKAEFGRYPSKKERTYIAKKLGFHLDKVKTHNRATDYTCRHATSEDVRRSSAVKSYVGKRPDFDDPTKPASEMPAPKNGGFHLYMAGKHKRA